MRILKEKIALSFFNTLIFISSTYNFFCRFEKCILLTQLWMANLFPTEIIKKQKERKRKKERKTEEKDRLYICFAHLHNLYYISVETFVQKIRKKLSTRSLFGNLKKICNFSRCAFSFLYCLIVKNIKVIALYQNSYINKNVRG